MREFSLSRLGGVVLAALGVCAPVLAEPEQPAQPAQATQPAQPAQPATAEPVFEPARQSVRSTAEWLASGVNSWFGDKPFSDGGKVSDGRLNLFLLTRQHQKTDFSVRFKARFWLPNLEDRAYLFLGRDDAREAVIDQPDALSRQQRLLRENNADPAFFAGLGYSPQEAVQFRLGFRGGLKPYAHARYGHTWRWGGADSIDLRETLFYTLDDHIGSTTALSYEHAWSPTLVLRWLNAATITQDSKKFDWSSSLGAYRSFGNQRLLSTELLLTGRQSSGVPATDIGVQVKWQQPIHMDWLLGEVLIGHFWPRPDALHERTRAWAVGAGLNMRF